MSFGYAAAPVEEDGVYPGRLNGSDVWVIRWNGEELGLVWGDRDEATEHYLLLSGQFVPIDRRNAAAARRARQGATI